jgi:hypothetical protein
MSAPEQHEIVIDLRDPETREALSRWGGQTLVRVLVYDERGNRAVAFLSARVSGDSRAGSQHGIHLRMSVNKRHMETSVERHVLPWVSPEDQR